ncbi:MAG: DNA polymerase, partial [Nevskiales bacterium]
MMLRALYIDFNSYFASVEQQDRPELRGKPVAVLPVMTDSTCCIAASYEAKRFGIKTGTNVGEAKRLCPGLVCVQARHELYVEYHQAILKVIDTCIPVDEVRSIDEMACSLTGSWRQ